MASVQYDYDHHSSDDGHEGCCHCFRQLSHCCCASPCGWASFACPFLARIIPSVVTLSVSHDGSSRTLALENIMRRLTTGVEASQIPLDALQSATDVAQRLPLF